MAIPSISIIIPVKNAEQTIRACIEGVLGQTLAENILEIIVLDNCSSDSTLEILSKYEKVRIINIPLNEFNHGLTRNIGIREARGDLIAFTVGDAWPADKFWLENLCSGFDDLNVAGVCGQQIVPHDLDKNPVKWFRPATGPTTRKILFENPEKFYLLSSKEKRELCGWDNVTAMYKKDVMTKVPFQNTLYAEDMIWAKEALLKGYAIVYNSAARVCHYHDYDMQSAFERFFIEYYYSYKTFGALPSSSSILGLDYFLRSAYLLAKESRVKLLDKLKWLKYNILIIKANRRAAGEFINTIKRGEGILDKRSQNMFSHSYNKMEEF